MLQCASTARNWHSATGRTWAGHGHRARSERHHLNGRREARKGLEDAKKEPHSLRGCVADGSCGVRLIASESRRGPSIQARAAWAMTPLNGQRCVLDHREVIGEDVKK